MQYGVMHICIKPATEEDVAAISECVQSAYAHYESSMGQKPGPMLQDYALIVREHLTYVARIARKNISVAGVLVLVQLDGGILLDNVAVNPGQQGKRIGSRLIAFAEAKAREFGYDEIQLYTHEKMTANIAMYKKLGYEEFVRRTEYGFNRVYMRKHI